MMATGLTDAHEDKDVETVNLMGMTGDAVIGATVGALAGGWVGAVFGIGALVVGDKLGTLWLTDWELER